MRNDTAGDPMSGLCWSRRSTRSLSQVLVAEGLAASPRTVARLLHSLQFSLRRNLKSIAPHTHPHRDEQFDRIAALRDERHAAGTPVISIDTKRKELIGRFQNHGVAWAQQPERVFDHDFPSWATGKAVPYGIYDLQANSGWVGLGLSSDTPCFAVDCLATWWAADGSQRYPGATQLLLLADSGGSNGYRPRAWKYYLQHTLCNPFQLTVTVAHYPSGCSKFNPIEHRLFSEISKNWSGVPLETVELILNYIQTTTTQTGLRVHAELILEEYRTGFKVSDDQMAALTLTRDTTLPQLNYTISPNSA